MTDWLQLCRPGDALFVLVGAALCATATFLVWPTGTGEKAVVRRHGEIYLELDLTRDRRVEVPGLLGPTEIIVDQRRVRVGSDPGPRQYCVRQGWLARPGEIAICAPNQVSVEILGSRRVYDSLSY
ncbi:NusG domain II-containing protein [Accumulibacter sp.]|uniref:NusG domain II-containing protein n=1 Tax=Accumulibacter sp. TaxID=2053492 RepID=UPI0026256931|nr:NusG domain II-containing protein [Accumulibacter sp.]